MSLSQIAFLKSLSHSNKNTATVAVAAVAAVSVATNIVDSISRINAPMTTTERRNTTRFYSSQVETNNNNNNNNNSNNNNKNKPQVKLEDKLVKSLSDSISSIILDSSNNNNSNSSIGTRDSNKSNKFNFGNKDSTSSTFSSSSPSSSTASDVNVNVNVDDTGVDTLSPLKLTSKQVSFQKFVPSSSSSTSTSTSSSSSSSPPSLSALLEPFAKDIADSSTDAPVIARLSKLANLKATTKDGKTTTTTTTTTPDSDSVSVLNQVLSDARASSVSASVPVIDVTTRPASTLVNISSKDLDTKTNTLRPQSVAATIKGVSLSTPTPTPSSTSTPTPSTTSTSSDAQEKEEEESADKVDLAVLNQLQSKLALLKSKLTSATTVSSEATKEALMSRIRLLEKTIQGMVQLNSACNDDTTRKVLESENNKLLQAGFTVAATKSATLSQRYAQDNINPAHSSGQPDPFSRKQDGSEDLLSYLKVVSAFAPNQYVQKVKVDIFNSEGMSAFKIQGVTTSTTEASPYLYVETEPTYHVNVHPLAEPHVNAKFYAKPPGTPKKPKAKPAKAVEAPPAAAPAKKAGKK